MADSPSFSRTHGSSTGRRFQWDEKQGQITTSIKMGASELIDLDNDGAADIFLPANLSDRRDEKNLAKNTDYRNQYCRNHVGELKKSLGEKLNEARVTKECKESFANKIRTRELDEKDALFPQGKPSLEKILSEFDKRLKQKLLARKIKPNTAKNRKRIKAANENFQLEKLGAEIPGGPIIYQFSIKDKTGNIYLVKIDTAFITNKKGRSTRQITQIEMQDPVNNFTHNVPAKIFGKKTQILLAKLYKIPFSVSKKK